MPMTKCLSKRGFRTAIAVACLGLAFEAVADVPPPPQQSEPLALRIEEDAESVTPRIVIPRGVLAKLAGEAAGTATLASATTARSILAAIAMSAAVACGLVASRRGRTGRLAAVMLCGLSVAGAGGLLVGGPAFADLAVPGGSPRQRPRPRPPADGPHSVTLARGDRVILEIANLGDEAAVLIVRKPSPAAK